MDWAWSKYSNKPTQHPGRQTQPIQSDNNFAEQFPLINSWYSHKKTDLETNQVLIEVRDNNGKGVLFIISLWRLGHSK